MAEAALDNIACVGPRARNTRTTAPPTTQGLSSGGFTVLVVPSGVDACNWGLPLLTPRVRRHRPCNRFSLASPERRPAGIRGDSLICKRDPRVKAMVILGGMLLPIHRVAADRPYYSPNARNTGRTRGSSQISFGRRMRAHRHARFQSTTRPPREHGIVKPGIKL